MTRFISSLLDKEKTAIKTTLESLEKASGETDIDAKFTSELIINANLKIRQLGLDPTDTTAQELYCSLLNLVGLHDSFLVRKLGGSDPSDTTDMIPRVIKFTNEVARGKMVWGIRHSVAKRLLKSNPPKQLMKKLGYRSLDSMLKREAIDNLYAGAYITESGDWLKQLNLCYYSLSTSDFESRNIVINFPNNAKWQKLSRSFVKKNKSNVVEIKELGSIVVIPLPINKLNGITILLLSLLLNGINEVQIYSSFFKFFQVKSNFGQIVADAISTGLDNVANIAGQDINWKVIHDHFMQIAKEGGNNDVFEPYIQANDLETDAAEENLYRIEPALHFWFGASTTGRSFKTGTVSFNLMDVATDYVNHLDVKEASNSYLRSCLWDELMKRYLKQEPMHEQVYDQIDSSESQDEFNDSVGDLAFA